VSWHHPNNRWKHQHCRFYHRYPVYKQDHDHRVSLNQMPWTIFWLATPWKHSETFYWCAQVHPHLQTYVLDLPLFFYMEIVRPYRETPLERSPAGSISANLPKLCIWASSLWVSECGKATLNGFPS